MPEKENNDRIKKYIQIYTKEDELHFGVSLRQSGAVDIYYNKKLRERVEGETFEDVMISFDTIYLIPGND